VHRARPGRGRTGRRRARVAAGPLAGLRVVDLTDLRGALAGRILGDLGADVVKVEPPGGDPGRLRPPCAGDRPGLSLAFLFRNANKRGAVIDLDAPAGRRRFEALCARADVLVDNLGPDAARRHGLAPAEVRARHPHLVHLAIADFGLSGPRARWRLEPLPAFAASGALFASGFPDRAPCWLPGYLAHDCAAVTGVAGALAALLARARHGGGDTIEVSVQEAALAGLDPWGIVLADYARRYPVLPAALPRDADGPALVLPTQDGYVRLLAITPRQLAALAALIAGLSPRAPRARPTGERPGRARVASGALADAVAQLAGRAVGALARLPLAGGALPVVRGALAVVRRVAGEALRRRVRAEVVADALGRRLPLVPVQTPDEFVAAPQTRARGYFQRTRFPHLAGAPFAPFPATFGRTPVTLRRPAPTAQADDHRDFASRPATRVAAGAPVAALAGVRVTSLGVGAVVPGLCRLLADLGAEVMKIEAAASPDFLRRLSVDPETPNRSWTFNDENRGQESVCLDLGTARGRALALDLCAASDVVAENRGGGVALRWGLDYDAVRRRRPDVVYLSSQGFGRGGPLGEAPAYGPLNAAFAGASWLWNHPDAPYPAGSSLEHPDHLAGTLAACAVLAALDHRRRTGEGQRIDLAQTEATAYLLGEFYLQGPTTGRPPAPQGNATDWACPHGVYPAAGADRWCAIAVVGDDAWERFRRVLGWPDEARLATLEGRLAARAELEARVTEWTRGRDAEDAAAALQAAEVSAMAVVGPVELRADAHLAARAALVTLDDPEIGPVRHTATPLRPHRLPLAPPRPAPRLGADTRAVLTRVLGLAAAEVDRLVAAGVCRTA
jgi:crotonobetainyl-CoA:carnitine CoA-transferase CaiB-like acyl-CoA transferase